ncbi:unnamed protein product [Moneuplotes crassus]|uniref:Uncharacterized protein n=1 Tax=Euplotes crassus TaxID=5936 RepID=A0AAD1U7D9_EUPCR|nr:unnamed protein product [Moneuplotes crassus]
MNITAGKKCPKCQENLGKFDIDEDGCCYHCGFQLENALFMNDIPIKLPETRPQVGFRDGNLNNIAKKIMLRQTGNVYQTSNEYEQTMKYKKLIEKCPGELHANLKDEALSLCLRFKQSSPVPKTMKKPSGVNCKYARVNKVVVAAINLIFKRENLLCDLRTLCKTYGVKEKGFLKFFASFKSQLSLNTTKECEPVDREYIFKIEKHQERPTLGETNVEINTNLSSSSEMAVVASSTGQVDKRKVETLSQLLKVYGSLIFLEALDQIEKLVKSSDTCTVETVKQLQKYLKYLPEELLGEFDTFLSQKFEFVHLSTPEEILSKKFRDACNSLENIYRSKEESFKSLPVEKISIWALSLVSKNSISMVNCKSNMKPLALAVVKTMFLSKSVDLKITLTNMLELLTEKDHVLCRSLKAPPVYRYLRILDDENLESCL